MVAIAVFSIFLSGIGLALVLGERSTVIGGDYARAGFLASEQLEALRHMQKGNFDSLTPGTYGIAIQGSTWAFTGSSVSHNGYIASVTLSEVNDDQIQANSNVRWNFGTSRSGSVTLTTYLTNWREATVIGNWASVSQVSSTLQSGTPDFQKVAVSGNYAYVVSTAGAGLYIYDVSNLAAPVRVASSFSLGGPAYGLTISGNRLYLATGTASQEVMVYDISNPPALSGASLVNDYDLPGSVGARSIAVYGPTVFVGTADSATNHHFYALSMSEDDDMELLSSMSTSGAVLGMGLNEGYAYVASAYDVGELLVIDIIDPEAVMYAPGTGVDLSGSQDGRAVIASGTSALLGRANGSSISELVLYEVGWSPVPSPPPGPWTVEIGGSVNDLVAIEGTRYAFVGSDASGTQLRVINMTALVQGGSPTLTTVNVGSAVNGLAYDWLTDRLFAVTAGDRLIIYRPN